MIKPRRKIIAGLLTVTLLANTAAFSVAANDQNTAANINVYDSFVNTPTVSFSFDDAEYPNVLMGTTTDMEFSLDGGVTYLDCMNNMDSSARLSEINAQNDILVRYKATGTESAGSPVTIDIYAGSPIVGVSKANCTTADNNNGTINGVTSTMEYRLNTDSYWTKVSGDAINGLQNGIYELRNGAAGTVLAGEVSEFVIDAYASDALSGTVTIDGVLKFGQSLIVTATNCNNTGTLSYQWMRDGVNIENATSDTYTTVLDDVGKVISCKVTSSVESGSITGMASAIIAKEDGATFNSVTFSFDDLTNANKLMGSTAEMEYSLDGGITYADCTENMDLTTRLSDIKTQYGINVRYKETGSHTAGSAQTISIYEGSPVTGVSKTDCTTTANNDGALISVTTAMEYKRSGDTQWIRVTGNMVSNLQNGTYEVRNHATSATLAGEASEFIIHSSPNSAYTVRVNGSYDDMTTGEGTYRENETVYISAGYRSNYRFNGWTTSDGVVFENPNSESTSFTMPAKSVAVTAQWYYEGGGGSSSNDDYYNTNNPPTVTPPASNDFSTPTTVQINLTARVDRDGYANVTIQDGQVQNAIKKAREGARKNGVEDNGMVMVMNINTNGEMVKSMVATIPRTVQQRLVNAKIINTVISMDQPDITMGFDFAAVKEIYNETDATVYLTAQRISNQRFSNEVKNITENRPIYDFKLNYGRNNTIRTLNRGKITMSIPYPLQNNESSENIQAVVVESSSRIQRQNNSCYENNSMRFVTNRFATYSTCSRQLPYFVDTQNHWAKNEIDFATSRGLFGGTSESIFSPDISMTRGMFVTTLGRLANVDVSGYRTSSFYDVKPYSYYVGYIEWAVKNGIVNGVSLGKFAPDSYITREQMAVIMSNYIKYIGLSLPKVQSSANAYMFADNEKIGMWAKDSVKSMNTAGIISGKNDNMFDPKGTTTRAQAATVLKRLMNMMIEGDMSLFKMANIN